MATSTAAKEKAEAKALKDSAVGEKYAPHGQKTIEKPKNSMFLDVRGEQEASKEVIVMKTWEDGTIYFVDPDHLDTIDRKRLLRALRRANRSEVELWTVLQETSLSNGANGLDYFHQLVQTYKPAGARSAPTAEQLAAVIRRDRDLYIQRAGPTPIRR